MTRRFPNTWADLRIEALSLELNLELSPSFPVQSQKAETKFVIKFETKLLSLHDPTNRRWRRQDLRSYSCSYSYS